MKKFVIIFLIFVAIMFIRGKFIGSSSDEGEQFSNRLYEPDEPIHTSYVYHGNGTYRDGNTININTEPNPLAGSTDDIVENTCAIYVKDFMCMMYNWMYVSHGGVYSVKDFYTDEDGLTHHYEKTISDGYPLFRCDYDSGIITYIEVDNIDKYRNILQNLTSELYSHDDYAIDIISNISPYESILSCIKDNCHNLNNNVYLSYCADDIIEYSIGATCITIEWDGFRPSISAINVIK